MRAYFLIFLVCSTVAGCSNEHDDLKQWMKETSKDMRGRVAPLPQVRPYTPVSYEAQSLLDPFNAAKLVPERKPGQGSGLQPDVTRRKEFLESFPLESLRMIGTVTRSGRIEALIQSDRGVFSVRLGNYMGQNFGVITKISEGEVQLKELAQDAAGDWIERTSSLLLSQEGKKEVSK